MSEQKTELPQGSPEPRKRRPHHLCPGPNCNERDVSKWVNDGTYFRPEDEIVLHKIAIAIQDARPATYKAQAAAALAAYRKEQADSESRAEPVAPRSSTISAAEVRTYAPDALFASRPEREERR